MDEHLASAVDNLFRAYREMKQRLGIKGTSVEWWTLDRKFHKEVNRVLKRHPSREERKRQMDVQKALVCRKPRRKSR